MEQTSFILGVLSMIAVIFITAFVLGMVKIFKQQRELNNINEHFKHIYQDLDNRFNSIYNMIDSDRRELHSQLDNLSKNLEDASKSYTDSRIDKLNAKTKTLLKD